MKRDTRSFTNSAAIEGIDHTTTKAKSPQTNGICERIKRTTLNEFYQVAFRTKVYASLQELQEDLDAWLKECNEKRPHSGKYCYGRTPMQTFLDTLQLAREKVIRYEKTA